MSRSSAPLLVVGGGLVGATAALSLARRGHAVTLVERAPPQSAAPSAGSLGVDLRTVALAPDSLALLREVGAWDTELEAAAERYGAMEVWDAEGTGRIRFEAAELGQPSLGVIVENIRVLRRLWQCLRDEGVTLRTGAGVTALSVDPGAGISIALDDGTRLGGRLVLAADGARSRVRELAGIGTEETDTGQTAIATVVATERPHGHTAWQRFLPTGPLAFLPLPDHPDGRHRCAVVWSLDRARAEEVAALDDAAFAAALGRAFERRLGDILAVDRRIGFPLVQIHARRYVAPGVVLVGDAAHVVHPLAGQGVNLGLRDVRRLVTELDRIRATGPLLDPNLLARYERERRGENALMLGSLLGLKRLFGADQLGIRLLRNAGLRFTDGSATIKRRLMVHALGLTA
ncbi:MAG: FAD-dependent oxidoreductase [Pseudomonadales bacterium]|jgi:2-octaprenylphenol hydroxylase|nr:FAD-dependent oxidoreductase [Pseudomonadales bacterium]